jgi:hypothetical protein
MSIARKNINIPEGWVAFYDSVTKKVVGITHFPSGGKAFTSLAFTVAATNEDLLVRIEEEGLIYTPPASS